MKKKLALIFAALIVLSVSSCAAVRENAATEKASIGTTSFNYSYDSDMAAYGYDDVMTEELEAPIPAAEPPGEAGGGASTGTGLSAYVAGNDSLAEKIIYTAHASIETITYDDAVKSLGELINKYGGFIESSSETGADYASKYYGYNPFRTADYTIRIPRESFNSFTNELSNLGSVTSLTTNAQNVTEQYTDIEARLTACRTQEESLLTMLAKAETVEDMITIESKLSEVRYTIESLTSKLRNIDSKVSYSSVSVYLREVEELKKVEPTHRTYWEQVSDGFAATLSDIGVFFKNLFKWFIVNLPVLLILAVIAVAVILVIRRGIHKARRDKNDNILTEDNNKDI